MSANRCIAVLGALLFVGTGLSAAASHHLKNARSRKAPTAQVAPQLRGRSETLLPDGDLLLIGGEGLDGPVATAGIVSAETGKYTELSTTLMHPRAWHTATLLPDGSILVFGGLDAEGRVETLCELLNISTQKTVALPPLGVTPRSSHTATVLTDGQVLFAGGRAESGEVTGSLELWNYRTHSASPAPVGLTVPRSKHIAVLLADGAVLFWGGVDATASPLDFGEVFDPETSRTRLETSPPQVDSKNLAPQLETSIPTDGATNVPMNIVISLRFSEPLSVLTLNSRTVTLTGPNGLVKSTIVPAEKGMLAFITPQSLLAAGSTYSVELNGAASAKGGKLPRTVVSFTTARPSQPTAPVTPIISPGAPAGPDSDLWTPTAANFQGAWRSGTEHSSWQDLPPLQAPPGVTALAGQALRLNGLPLKGVTLKIDDKTAKSDDTGRFLLSALAPGHHVMVIDGRTANVSGRTYGTFEVGVDTVDSQTTALKYTIWMTRLDTAHAVTIPSPTRSAMVITTPLIPGLELHLPLGTVIRDLDRRVVTSISMTPVPINQPPFPLPRGVGVPFYFTIQPGGAVLEMQPNSWSHGAQLYYPNPHHIRPGTPFSFWNYDPEVKGWYVYGMGKVSANGSTVIPNPGVEIYKFSGAMVSQPSNDPEPDPKPCCEDGDPVDLGTGLFIESHTDLSVQDVIPIALTRTYRTSDYVSRAFGIGTTHNYNIFLSGDNNTFPEGYTYQDLILPDGGKVHFVRTSPCDPTTGYCDFSNAVYAAVTSIPAFCGATIQFIPAATPVSDHWTLTTKDGAIYTFPDSDASTVPQTAALTGYQDRNGNKITLIRWPGQNLSQVISPNGRWIYLTYDSDFRVVQAQDNSGRTVNYTYDSGGRLASVTDPMGGVSSYTYDSNNNMLTAQDPLGNLVVTNLFDSNGRVAVQTQADGSTFQFSYTLNDPSCPSITCAANVQQTNVTHPNGDVRQVSFNSDGYATSETAAYGQSYQETASLARQSGSDLVLSSTDALGRQTAFTYDLMGNVTSVTQLAGTSDAETTYYTYEPIHNQVSSVTDPLGHTTSYTYDANGNAVRTTDPLGDQSSTAFNPMGQPTSTTDAMGNSTSFGYSSGDLTFVIDPLGRTTTEHYDGLGRLTSASNALGQSTSYAYDLLDRMTSIADAEGNQTTYAYDPNGNLVSVTDANGHSNSFAYDPMNRVISRTDPLQRTETFQYDLNGNLSIFTDRRGQLIHNVFDALNRRQTQSWSGGQTTYTYDAGARLIRVAVSADGGGQISRLFDNLDRLVQENTPQGSVSYSYDAAGRRIAMTAGSQAPVNYTYDNANRLTQMVQGNSVVSFAYDGADRRTSLSSPDGSVIGYTYDAASQLTQLTFTVGGYQDHLTYGYDLAGRRTSASGDLAVLVSQLPSPIASASYDAANELTQWGSSTLTYDANGNMLSDGTNTFEWDPFNRLASMNTNSESFEYDAFGRRISNTSPLGSTNYLYDGVNEVEESTNGSETIDFLMGATDETFQATYAYYGGESVNFFPDALGSTLLLTQGGQYVEAYAYDPFGNTQSEGALGPSDNSHQFTGRENDGTGLYYFRARYYNPQFGRFISEDPAGFGGNSVNFYEYTYDAPTDFTDPFGTQPTNGPTPPDPCIKNPELCYPVDPGPYGPRVDPLQPIPPAPTPPHPPTFWNKTSGATIEDVPVANTSDFWWENRPDCKKQPGCQPCVPPVGTVTYRLTPSRGHYPMPGPHYSLYVMIQSPAPACKCRWSKLGVGQGQPIGNPIGPTGGGGPI